jgi:cytochrome c peroxidase
MIQRKVVNVILFGVVVLLVAASVSLVSAEDLTDEEELGKAIFFDENLSLNGNQSCAVCHGPEVGWTGPDEEINKGGTVYEGSIPGAFGDRKPPSSAYAGDSPILGQDAEGTWVGGMFWDGRATGETLGDPLAEQAQGPFLNPKEQALPNAEAVVEKVCASEDYGDLFREVWGQDACDDVVTAYNNIAFSIAAYERSKEVNQFTSKYDYWLKGQAKLTGQERRGLELFNGKAKCNNCHVSGSDEPFTDFTYDNLGVPQNPENPAGVAPAFVDPGLGGFLETAGYSAEVYEAEWGKHKVPTLRNVDLRPSKKFIKTYGHNGYFKSLEGIVHFYNTRDVLPRCKNPLATEAEALKKKCWPAPEVAENVNTDELGSLGLTKGEENAIVAFLKTLSDGYKP